MVEPEASKCTVVPATTVVAGVATSVAVVPSPDAVPVAGVTAFATPLVRPTPTMPSDVVTAAVESRVLATEGFKWLPLVGDLMMGPVPGTCCSGDDFLIARAGYP